MTFNINEIKDDLVNGAIVAAKSVAISALKEAAGDAIGFVTLATPRLERYIQLLLEGKITFKDFTSLMYGLADVAEMSALTAAGLASVEVDRTRNAILKSVISITIGSLSKFI